MYGGMALLQSDIGQLQFQMKMIQNHLESVQLGWDNVGNFTNLILFDKIILL